MDILKAMSSFSGASLQGEWSFAPEVHVGLICMTLLMAAVGRHICAFGFQSRWRWIATCLVTQALGVSLTALALAQASAAGLLSATVLLGLAAFLVVVPRGLGWNALWSCCAYTLLVASLLTPQMLPTLLPATPLSLSRTRTSDDAFVIPFSGARVFFSPSLSVIANPVLNVFDHVQLSTLIPRAPLTLHKTSILSSGDGARLWQLNLTLSAGSQVVMLGENSRIDNCTLRCESVPCLWLLKAHASRVMLRDVRIAFEAQQWYAAAECGADLCDAASVFAPAIRCLQAPSNASPSASPSVFSHLEPVVATAATARQSNRGPTALDMDMLRSVAPLSMLALEQVPAVLGFCTAMCGAVHNWVVMPCSRTLVFIAGQLIAYAAPALRYVYETLCKLATAVTCRAISWKYVQGMHCEAALRFYESDAQFAMMQAVTDMVVDALKDFNEIPLVSPSLRIAWELETKTALVLWRCVFEAFVFLVDVIVWVWPFASSILLGRFLRSITRLMHDISALVWWSLSIAAFHDPLDGWAWRLNVGVLGGLRILMNPLLSFCVMLLSAAWRLVRVYQTTSVSTHLLICFLQTALLGMILYRDFRGRVSTRVQSQNWFMRTVATIPLAVASMLRHYSTRTATYMIVHLVAMILVVGTSVIPFGGTLYTLVLQFVFPVASTYAWTVFFHDAASDDAFWWRIAWSSGAKGLGCVLVQKTLGDFVFHIVWEICVGILMVGVGFLGLLWARRGSQRAASTPLSASSPTTSLDEVPLADTRTGSAREIH
jgi:hypothetical protein